MGGNSHKTLNIKFYLYHTDDEFDAFTIRVPTNSNDQEVVSMAREEFEKLQDSELGYEFGTLYYTFDPESEDVDQKFQRLVPNKTTKTFLLPEIKCFQVGVKLSVQFNEGGPITDMYSLPLSELYEVFEDYEDLFLSHGMDSFDQLSYPGNPTFTVTSGTYSYIFADCVLVPSFLFFQGNDFYSQKEWTCPIWGPLSLLKQQYPNAISFIGRNPRRPFEDDQQTIVISIEQDESTPLNLLNFDLKLIYYVNL